jgi:hypothetical protein
MSKPGTQRTYQDMRCNALQADCKGCAVLPVCNPSWYQYLFDKLVDAKVTATARCSLMLCHCSIILEPTPPEAAADHVIPSQSCGGFREAAG